MRFQYSKASELVISASFKDKSEIQLKTLIDVLDRYITTRNNIATIGEIDPQDITNINKLFIELKENFSTQIISKKHLVKTAVGIAQHEWVGKVMIFHIITAISIITNHKSNILKEYTNSQVMFEPPSNNFILPSSIVRTALLKPLYHMRDRIDLIASALCTYDNISFVGENGSGRKSILLTLIREIAIGNYPLLYNSVFLWNPTKHEFAEAINTKEGSHIIAIMEPSITNSENATIASPNSINNHSRIAKRAKFIYLYTPEQLRTMGQGLSMANIEYHKIEHKPITKEELINIIDVYISILKQSINFKMDNDAKDLIIKAASLLKTDSNQPSKTIDLLVEFVFNKFNNMCTENNIIEIPSSIDENMSTETAQNLLNKLTKTNAFDIIKQKSSYIYLTVKDAEEFVSSKFKITPEVMATLLSINTREHLKNIKEKITKFVFGQDNAVNEIVKAMKRRAIGLDKMERPVSFLFIGPTGTGKSYVAKILSKITLGSEQNMVRFDMSEYGQSHEVSKLIGSPPGYVGSNQPGRLSVEIQKNPHCILLLDEIEKAHPDILNIFLQIFDDGRFTDNHGKTIDFSKTMIIMTSNIGIKEAEAEMSQVKMGFNSNNLPDPKDYPKKIMAAVDEYFKPEVLNRLSKIVLFNKLGDEQFKLIVKARLEEIKNSTFIKLSYNEDDLAEKVFKVAKEKPYNINKYNARELKRVIIDHVESKIIDAYDLTESSDLKINVVNDEILVENNI